MGRLTAKKIENLTEAGTYEDGNGLRLVVKASGRKSWVLRFQLAGQRREMGLGSYPTLGLKEARLTASAQRRQLVDHIDPLATRNVQRKALRAAQQAEAAKTVTFKEAALAYIAAHRAGWKNVKHAQQWESTLSTYAYPIIGHLSVQDVSTAHVLEILQPIWTTKTETASRVRNRVELVLDAAKARNLRNGENPARWRGHLDKLFPKRSKVRTVKGHAAMPWAELPGFMSELGQLEAISARALELTILSACRTSEVIKARWTEVDLERGIWTIPAERMKAGKEHRVPLCEAILASLARVPRVESNPHLFPGMKTDQPLSNLAMTMTMRRLHKGHFTVHGFRSTFRDWAAERTHYPREVCEMALAHRTADGAEAAYWRSDIFDKRRALMADWARYATTPPTGQVMRIDFTKLASSY